MPQVAIPIAIGIAAGAVMASSMMPSNQQADYSTKINTSGTQVEMPVIYGKTRVGAHRIFNEVVGSSGQAADTLTVIYTLGHGEINSINQIYIDERPLFNTEKAFTKGTVGKADLNYQFADHVQVQVHNGHTNGFRFTMAEQNSDGKWTSAHKCKGVAAICLKIKLDGWKGLIKGDNFNVTTLVEGKKIPDVRYHGNPVAYRLTSGKEVGRNPALCLLDYMTNTYYGCDFNYEEVDIDSFITAANWCDSHGLTCDGVVNQRQAYKKNIEEMLSSMGGALLDLDGVIHCVVDAPAPVTSHFNKDNILQGVTKVKYDDPKKYFNQLETTWTNPANQYQKDVSVYPPNAYTDERIQRDGRVINQRLELPYTKSKAAVNYLSSKECKKSDDTTVITFDADMDGFLTGVWEVIDITLPELNYIRKPFRVLSIRRNLFGKNFGRATITAIEYQSSAYQNPWEGNTQSGARPLNFVPSARGLVFQFVENKSGLTGKLHWDFSGGKVRDAAVYYKITGTPDSEWTHLRNVDENECIVTGLQPLHYDFMVINRNLFGDTSTPAYLNGVNLADETILPAVTGLSVDATDRDFKLSWDDMSQEEVITNSKEGVSKVINVMAGYEITVLKGGREVAKYLTMTPNYIYDFATNSKQALSREVDFEVRIVTAFGAESPLRSIRAHNLQCPVPDGVEVGGSVAGLRVSWDASEQPDYDFSEVHISKTPDFTPTPDTLYKKVFGNEMVWMDDLEYKGYVYIKVGATDVFGGNIVYSQEYTTRVETITDMIEEVTSTASSKAVRDALKGADESMKQIHDGKWGFTMDTNGLISGMAMMNDGTTSSFGISADTFAIYNGSYGVAPFVVTDGKVLIKDAHIGDLDAAKITSGYINSGRIESESIDVTKLTADCITSIHAQFDVATIGAATIGYAQIKDDMQSTNYVAGKQGWKIGKGGFMEMHSATFRGNIVSSFIKGAFIEGGIVMGGTDFVTTTEADNGSQPRKACHAGISSSIACSSPDGNGWTSIGRADIASADYTGDGEISYSLFGGNKQRVAANFKRSRKHSINVNGYYSISSSLYNRYSYTNYGNFIIEISGVRKNGQRVVLAYDTLWSGRNGKVTTHSVGLGAGYGGSLTFKGSTFSYTTGDSSNRNHHTRGYISACDIKLTSIPARIKFQGNYRYLDIRIYGEFGNERSNVDYRLGKSSGNFTVSSK